MTATSLKPGSKGIMALIIVAAVIFVGGVLAGFGVAGKMKNTKAEYEAKLEKVEESKEIAQKLEKSRLEYQDALSQIRFLETSVSTEAYVPTLLKQIEALSTSVNLKVTEVKPTKEVPKAAARTAKSGAKAAEGKVEDASKTKPGDEEDKPKEAPYDEVNIALELKGKYSNVLDFLYKLTSFPKILAVKSISISPSDSQPSYKNSPALSVNMTITAFVLKKDVPVSLPDALDAPGVPEAPAAATTSVGEGRTENEAG